MKERKEKALLESAHESPDARKDWRQEERDDVEDEMFWMASLTESSMNSEQL